LNRFAENALDVVFSTKFFSSVRYCGLLACLHKCTVGLILWYSMCRVLDTYMSNNKASDRLRRKEKQA